MVLSRRPLPSAMRVLRGRLDDPTADRAATDRLREWVAGSGEAGLRVWYPPKQVVFGRVDRHASGYDAARAAARERGFPTVERAVGGRAVAFAGGTLAFVRATPTTDGRRGVGSRYDEAIEQLRDALADLGVDARPGEPPASFCPGSHSLQADGKVAGLAQRIRSDVTVVGGVVVVDDPEAVAAVLAPVYEALGVSFAPDSVGSLATAGGPTDRERVRARVESALVTGETDVRRVDRVSPREPRRRDHTPDR